MRIEFVDREYRWSHGKAPRGWGWWLFTFEGCHEFNTTGTLTEAKKDCKAYIRRIAPKGYNETVYVTIEP